MIAWPITIALERTELEELIDGRTNAPWNIDGEKLTKVIEDTIASELKKQTSVVAYCPVGGFSRDEPPTFQIASDVTLKGLTDRDTRLFLSRFHSEFLWDDFKSPTNLKTIAQITLSNIPSAGAVLAISERLDQLKWALLLAFEQNKPIVEGTCLLEGPLYSRVGKFRRDDNFSGAHYPADNQKFEKCSNLLKSF